MASSTHRRPASFWAVLLLVLAVSPVTAPFSACGLEDFFSTRDAQPGAIFQSKTVPAPALSGASAGPVLELPRLSADLATDDRPASLSGVKPVSIPLRI